MLGLSILLTACGAEIVGGGDSTSDRATSASGTGGTITSFAIATTGTGVIGTAASGPATSGMASTGSGGVEAVDSGIADVDASDTSDTSTSSGWVPPGSTACARTGVDPGPSDPLGHLKYAIAATWSGTATAPVGWTSTMWPVWMRFDANGDYSAHSLDPNVPAFYYGSDDDVAGKTYTLDDVQGGGSGVGTIQIYFFANDWNTGDLEYIAVSSDLSAMKFEFWKDGHGPVLYHLTCVP